MRGFKIRFGSFVLLGTYAADNNQVFVLWTYEFSLLSKMLLLFNGLAASPGILALCTVSSPEFDALLTNIIILEVSRQDSRDSLGLEMTGSSSAIAG